MATGSCSTATSTATTTSSCTILDAYLSRSPATPGASSTRPCTGTGSSAGREERQLGHIRYDLSSSTETRLNLDASAQIMPDIYGSYVVYEDYRNATPTSTCTTSIRRRRQADHDRSPVQPQDRRLQGRLRGREWGQPGGLHVRHLLVLRDAHHQPGGQPADPRHLRLDHRVHGRQERQRRRSTASRSAARSGSSRATPGAQTRPRIWSYNVVYADLRVGAFQDVSLFDCRPGRRCACAPNPGTQNAPCVYGDKVAWADSRTSSSDTTSTRASSTPDDDGVPDSRTSTRGRAIPGLGRRRHRGRRRP